MNVTFCYTVYSLMTHLIRFFKQNGWQNKKPPVYKEFQL